MKRMTLVIAVFAFTIGIGVSLASDGEKTIEGILVDTDCYFASPALHKGNDHGQVKRCGTLCAKMGKPVGLLTAEGKFSLLVVASSRLADHIGQTLRATGTIRNRVLLLPTKLEFKEGETWKEIRLGSMK